MYLLQIGKHLLSNDIVHQGRLFIFWKPFYKVQVPETELLQSSCGGTYELNFYLRMLYIEQYHRWDIGVDLTPRLWQYLHIC